MSEFRPAKFLRNRHTQSILGGLNIRRPVVRFRGRNMLQASRSMLLDCGEGATWHGYYSPHLEAKNGPRKLAILIHGWEGSANSLYLISAADYLYRQGYEVFRLNMRDHGATHHLNVELFHSGRITEAVGAVARLQSLFPDHVLYLAGFSLGGNFCLRIATRAPEAGIDLKKVVAVSPVLEPRHTLEALDNGFFGYKKYFVTKWRRSLNIKQNLFPDIYDFSDIPWTNGLMDMTERFVDAYAPYPNLQTYLSDYAITGNKLENLAVSSTLITSQDDPMIPIGDLDRVARTAALDIVVTEFGGHCGFLEGLDGSSWIDGQIHCRFAEIP